MSDPNHTIIIGVKEGIAFVIDNPSGCNILVRDYDVCEGYDEELQTDDNGELYHEKEI